MTMALSAPLQKALFQLLTGAPELAAISSRMFDDASHQSADASEAYVTLGDEVVRPWNTATESGAIHEVKISVYSQGRGFLAAKLIAADLCAVLCGGALILERGVVVTQDFAGAATKREEQGALRRIELSFRYVIEDAPAI